MSTALDKIIDYKRDEVAALKREHSATSYVQNAPARTVSNAFRTRLERVSSTGQNALICEMKRKSPSAGDILPGANPTDIAQMYEAGGAACLSVLTDGPSFGGSLSDFRAIREKVSIPMLRKDFMIDPIQVAEAYAYGADAILVILSCTDDHLALDLIQTATDLGMDALIETHNEAELKRASNLPSTLIGINNRDLKRMVTDLRITEDLAHLIPADRTLISESGITTPKDIIRLRKTPARCFLIGESLMKRPDRQAYTAALRAAK